MSSNLTLTATYKFARQTLRGWDVKLRSNLYVSPSINMYYVYVLQSQKDKSLYIGYTTDLERRFAEHNSGKSQATRPFRPYELIYYEAFVNMKDAKSREEYLKSGWGRRTITKMLKGYLSQIC